MLRYNLLWDVFSLLSFRVILRHPFRRSLLILFQVRVFNLSRLSGTRPREISMEPAAVYQCHSRRVKKLAVRS